MRTPCQSIVQGVEQECVVAMRTGHSAHPRNIGHRDRCWWRWSQVDNPLAIWSGGKYGSTWINIIKEEPNTLGMQFFDCYFCRWVNSYRGTLHTFFLVAHCGLEWLHYRSCISQHAMCKKRLMLNLANLALARPNMNLNTEIDANYHHKNPPYNTRTFRATSKPGGKLKLLPNKINKSSRAKSYQTNQNNQFEFD